MTLLNRHALLQGACLALGVHGSPLRHELFNTEHSEAKDDAVLRHTMIDGQSKLVEAHSTLQQELSPASQFGTLPGNPMQDRQFGHLMKYRGRHPQLADAGNEFSADFLEHALHKEAEQKQKEDAEVLNGIHAIQKKAEKKKKAEVEKAKEAYAATQKSNEHKNEAKSKESGELGTKKGAAKESEGSEAKAGSSSSDAEKPLAVAKRRAEELKGAHTPCLRSLPKSTFGPEVMSVLLHVE